MCEVIMFPPLCLLCKLLHLRTNRSRQWTPASPGNLSLTGVKCRVETACLLQHGSYQNNPDDLSPEQHWPPSTPPCCSCVKHLFTSILGYILWLCLGESCETKDMTRNSILRPLWESDACDEATLMCLGSAFPPNYYEMINCVVVCETICLHQGKPLLHVPHISHPISGHTSQTRFMASVYNPTLNCGNVSLSWHKANTVRIIQTSGRLWAQGYYKNVCLHHNKQPAT